MQYFRNLSYFHIKIYTTYHDILTCIKNNGGGPNHGVLNTSTCCTVGGKYDDWQFLFVLSK